MKEGGRGGPVITDADLAEWEAELHAVPNPVVRAAKRIEAAAAESYPPDLRAIAEAIERETGHRAKTTRFIAEIRRLRGLIRQLDEHLDGRCPAELRAAVRGAGVGVSE